MALRSKIRIAEGDKTPLPWKLPVCTDAEILAVQALANRRADAEQQRIAWDFIRRLAGADMMSFWPGGEEGRRATDFAEGKRWLADQLRRISRLVPKRNDDEPPPMPTPASHLFSGGSYEPPSG